VESSHVCLGALIRNGTRPWLYFYSLRIVYELFWINDETSLYEISWCGLCAKAFYVDWTNSVAKFGISYVKWFWRINCYLFSLWIFKKCSIPFKVVKLWFIFKKFLCRENGVLQVGSWSPMFDFNLLSSQWSIYKVALCASLLHIMYHPLFIRTVVGVAFD
jgi:hypothetical protein